MDKFIISKKLPLKVNEAWTWITESSKTEKWYGPFRVEGDALFTKLIQEEGQPEVEGRILDCKPNETLKLKLGTTDDSWIIELKVDESKEESIVKLIQDKTGTEMDPWIEAGWVFYLDCLEAAILEKPMPVFDNYAPGEEAPSYEG